MIPVTQFILGNSDPLLYPSEKMTNSVDEQIAFLQSQKQAINEAYRRNAIPNANNGTTQNQQVPTQGIWDAIDARGRRGGRGVRSGRGGMRNRIGYDTYDTYGRPSHKDDKEEKILTMFMSGGYNDGEYHFDEYEAKEVVEQMYHVKDNKKYVGEKYDMNKAHEICERYKEVLPDDVEPCDVYVAINAQYHDYCKLFDNWFGGNIDNKVFESAITFWFKDVDFDGDKVWEYFHMNN